MRIGYGWDSHEFKRGVPLKIGGVKLPHNRGLAGHSDGDVLLHALTDALLGAVAAGDIGGFFPPSDARWKNADSAIFVAEALRQVSLAGYTVGNVDSTLILSQPKIGPHAPKIQQHVAKLLKIPAGAVGVKAKTPEGMGTDNAAIAHVVVLLLKKTKSARDDEHETAAEPDPQLIDQVVKNVLQSVNEDAPRTTKATSHQKRR
jgi:2-C-methyl-D-erythritol 2,4-cyclodiphosphate synthase